MRCLSSRYVVGAAIWLALAASASAQVPQLIAYQGRLSEANGSPLKGEHAVTFRMYDSEKGGSELWEETHPLTLAARDNGTFSLVLGSMSSLNEIDFNQSLWLTLEIDGEGEMAPRLRLTAVGYAINADTLDGHDANAFASANHAHDGSAPTEHTHADFAAVNHAHTGYATIDHVHIGFAPADHAHPVPNRASASATSALTIATSDTELLSVTVTKSSNTSVLHIIATTQLTHTANPNAKNVELKLFRNAAQLDGTYTARIGSSGGAVQMLPATLQAWDTAPAGLYTFILKGRSSATGAQAGTRRLTVIEHP